MRKQKQPWKTTAVFDWSPRATPKGSVREQMLIELKERGCEAGWLAVSLGGVRHAAHAGAMGVRLGDAAFYRNDLVAIVYFT